MEGDQEKRVGDMRKEEPMSVDRETDRKKGGKVEKYYSNRLSGEDTAKGENDQLSVRK